jgi:transposase, IS30 family
MRMENPSKDYQQLQPEDRVTISSLRKQNHSIRAIVQVLQRPASTIRRELHRNSTGDHYGSVPAQQACQRRCRQSRPRRKLNTDSVLFGFVQQFLQQRLSPERIAPALAYLYSKGHEYL